MRGRQDPGAGVAGVPPEGRRPHAGLGRCTEFGWGGDRGQSGGGSESRGQEDVADLPTCRSGDERRGRGSHRPPGAGPAHALLGVALTSAPPDLHTVPGVPEGCHLLRAPAPPPQLTRPQAKATRTSRCHTQEERRVRAVTVLLTWTGPWKELVGPRTPGPAVCPVAPKPLWADSSRSPD